MRDDSYSSVETELLCFTVEQGENIVNVSKPNGRASVVVKNPFLFKKWHIKILTKTGLKGKPVAIPSIWRFIVMFVTGVCMLFLIKLRWPKKWSIFSEGR